MNPIQLNSSEIPLNVNEETPISSQENRVVVYRPSPTFQTLGLDMHLKIASFIPDELRNFSQTCKSARSAANSYRTLVWNTLSTDPILQLMQQSKRLENLPIREKLVRLNKNLRLPDETLDLKTINDRARKTATVDSVYLRAVEKNDENLIRLCKQNRCLSSEGIQEGFVIAARMGNLPLLKNLYVDSNTDSNLLNSIQVTTETIERSFTKALKNGHIETAKFLIGLKYEFNGDTALDNAALSNNPEIIALILQSRPQIAISDDYNPRALMTRLDEFSSPGLQEAILTAIQHNSLGALDTLLSLSNPSSEILEHARDVAIYYQVAAQAQDQFPDQHVINTRGFYFAENETIPERRALRNAIPNRFKSFHQSGLFSIEDIDREPSRGQHPFSKQQLIDRLNREIALRSPEEEKKEMLPQPDSAPIVQQREVINLANFGQSTYAESRAIKYASLAILIALISHFYFNLYEKPL